MDLRPVEWAPTACTLPTAERPLRMAEFDDLSTGGELWLDVTVPDGQTEVLDALVTRAEGLRA